MTTLREALKAKFPELPEPPAARPTCYGCGEQEGAVELREMDTPSGNRIHLCLRCFSLDEAKP